MVAKVVWWALAAALNSLDASEAKICQRRKTGLVIADLKLQMRKIPLFMYGT